MVSLAEVRTFMQARYPAGTAEGWDAVGLTCGDPAAEIGRVLLAVDCVPATVAQAREMGAQLLLTHHPLLLTAVHGVPADDPKGGLVHRMISDGIAHFVSHTNADVAVDGVSQALADVLGLTQTAPLDPRADSALGGGRIGDLATPTTLRAFLSVVAAALPGTEWGVRAAGHPDQVLRRVAVCGGSGGGYAAQARALGADVFLTADLKHHNALEIVTERSRSEDPASAPMALVDAAHWATEWPWLAVLQAVLQAEFGDRMAVSVSELVTDPWTLHTLCTPR